MSDKDIVIEGINISAISRNADKLRAIVKVQGNKLIKIQKVLDENGVDKSKAIRDIFSGLT